MKMVILVGLIFAFANTHGQTATTDKSFVAIYSTGQNWKPEKTFPEQQFAGEHSAFLSDLRKSGVITAGFRAGEYGYVFFASPTLEEARAIFERDPSVSGRTFSVNIQPVTIFYKGCIE